jgi:hypothetical protein
MKSIARLGVALVVVCVCLGQDARAFAQQNPPATPPPQQRQQPARGQRQGQQPAANNPVVANLQVQQMLNALVLGKAQTALTMSDEQYTAFFPRMKQLQDLRGRHAAERRRMLNQLARLTGPQSEGADDATLDARTKALDDLEVKMADDERKAMTLVDSGLTSWQRARFRVFEETMETEKLRMLARVLKGTPAPPATPVKGPGGRQ